MTKEEWTKQAHMLRGQVVDAGKELDVARSCLCEAIYHPNSKKAGHARACINRVMGRMTFFMEAMIEHDMAKRAWERHFDAKPD